MTNQVSVLSEEQLFILIRGSLAMAQQVAHARFCDQHPMGQAEICKSTSGAIEQLDALCATVKAANTEVRTVLETLGSDVVHIRENGEEDIYASLAATVINLQRERDHLRDDLEERTEQREVFKERLDTEMNEHSDTESRLSEVEKELQALREENERLRKIAEDALRFRVEMNGPCNHDEHMTKLCTQCEIRAALEKL